MVQTFTDLEDRTQEALSTFEEIKECSYLKKELGHSGQYEIMTCDCREDWDGSANQACSEESGCINRVTSVECVDDECGCGVKCRNQRFQRKEYSDIAVIDAGKKGYGVRAESDIEEGQFIYEYIGEVIDETTFRRRMVEYDEKKFHHFYFMMLKKDSFIDATVKGSLARFCNHSCNPNAFVDKWVVKDKLRMGIFAKRFIQKGEEITFDYNVDRYGAQSQPCYCGEPNCLKFMGGKTQTDSALLLPDGVAEALGVTPSMERAWLRENKHLRAKQQAEDSVVNELFIKSIEVKPVQSNEVSKVMGALMKSQDKYVVDKLLARIQISSDPTVNSVIIRLHGYKTMSQLLKKYGDDDEAVIEILQILSKWPRMTKNKISSSQIEDVIKEIQSTKSNDKIKSLSNDLLAEWGELQMAYRIPKNESPMIKHSRSRSPERRDDRRDDLNTNNGEGTSSASYEVIQPESHEQLPEGWEMAFDENSQSIYYFHRELGISRWDKPTRSIPKGPKEKKEKPLYKKERKHENDLYMREEERLKQERERKALEVQQNDKLLQAVIIQSQKEAEEKRIAEEKLKLEAAQREKERQKKKLEYRNGKHKAIPKETSSRSVLDSWIHVLAKLVPYLIRDHEKEIGHDNLKGCAKDIVKILAEKEVKKNDKKKAPEHLESSKRVKIETFCNAYMDKFVQKRRAKKRKLDVDKSDSKI